MNLEIKENSSTFLLKVYDNDQDFVRCDYAVVKITNSLLERLSKLRKGREAIGSYKVTDWASECVFLNQDEFDEGEMVSDEMLVELEGFTKDNAGVWQIEPVDLNELPQLRTESDQVEVCSYGVKFTAVGKWSGVEYDTEKISWDVIDKMVLED